jgi:hypothetical protein
MAEKAEETVQVLETHEPINKKTDEPDDLSTQKQRKGGICE